MRAVVITGHGGPEVLQVQERPDPPVGPGEVRIAVKAAGINFADTMARVGLYPDAPKPPCVVGYEVAGEVESVGDGVEDGQGRRQGDRGYPLRRPGRRWSPSRRTRCCRCRTDSASSRAPPSRSTTRPPTCALVMMGGIREGDRVLIHAAAGGVGISAIQIARSRDAEIFGTASASKHDAIREQGVRACDRLPHPGLRAGGQAAHGRRGRRPDHGRDRADQLPQGLPPAARGRPAGHVRALRGLDRHGPRHEEAVRQPRPDAVRHACPGGRACS